MKHFPHVAIVMAFLSLAPLICAAQPPSTAPSFDLPDNFYPVLSWDLPMWSAKYFSDQRSGVASLKRCGFTVAAFVRPQHLAAVEKSGLRCILAPQEFPTPWRTMTDAQIESAVKTLVDEGSANPSIMGYFLADEPGAPDFPALAKAVAAVREFAPHKLAYINLFPDYATLGAADLSQLGAKTYTDYLEQYVKIVHPQFISYDNYRIQFSTDQKDAAVAASYYANLMEIRRIAMKYDLPFWNIVSSNRIVPEQPIPSPANMLLQAYTTLAAGAKGLTWYTYYSPGYWYAPIDPSSHPTATWPMLKMVNDQVKVLGPILRPMVSTGVFFTAPLPASSLPKLPGTTIKDVKTAVPVMIGEFRDPVGASSVHYAVIVNLSLRESAPLEVLTNHGEDIQQFSPVDASLSALEKGNLIWLSAGQGVLLKFTPHAAQTTTSKPSH